MPSTTETRRHLSDALHSLFALAEAYPELKASTHFLDLQRQLVTTEDRIQAARRLYNSDVRDYNRRVSSFPSMLVARVCGYRRADYFELEPSLRDSVPDVTPPAPNA